MFEHGWASSNRFYEIAMRHVGDGLIIVDGSNAIVWSNEVADRMFGYTPDGLNGHSLDTIVPPAHSAHHRRYIENFEKHGRSQIVGKGRAVSGQRADGILIDLYVNVTRMSEGGQNFFLAVMRDVTIEREIQRSFKCSSELDFLTQLRNRESFIEDARVMYERETGKGETLSLCILNVGGLGRINRWVGYDSGDLVLHEIGTRLSKRFKGKAVTGRVDGNEFAVLAKSSDIAQEMDEIRHRLRQIGARIDIGDRHLDFSFTLGIAATDVSSIADGSDALFAAARSALHEARTNPYSPIVIYDDDLSRKERISRNLEEHLVDALANDEFSLVYQPKVDNDRQIAGYEVLLRWNTSDGEAVSPADFIPIAEANGTIETIGAWVFEESCRVLPALQEAAGRPVRLAVNLSPRQLENPALPEILMSIAGRTGIDPDMIELEITESWAVKDYEVGSGQLRRLKDCGFHLSLDDFGSGYSSLSALVTLPVDVIKIDRSLLPGDVSRNEAAHRLLKAAADCCRAANCAVLVEGAETEDQLDVIRELGCEYVQGFLISKPLTLDAAMEFAKA